MKKTLAARLVLGALATIAAGGVMAGQIQSASTQIAREVIVSNVQQVNAPTVGYRFAGDVDARSQAQTFQVQFILAQGEWTGVPKKDSLSISDSMTGKLQAQLSTRPAADTAPPGLDAKTDGATAAYYVEHLDISADKKTLYATVVVAKDAGALIRQPLVSINVLTNMVDDNTLGTTVVAPADRAKIIGLKDVVGDIVDDFNSKGICQDVKKLPISFKHFTAPTNPTAVATDTDATPDEHLRASATNSATLISFPTNLLVTAHRTAANKATYEVVTSAGGSKNFAGVAGHTGFVNITLAVLGAVSMTQNGHGYDYDARKLYQLAGYAGETNVGVRQALTATVPAGANSGRVEAKALVVTLNADRGFSIGGTTWLDTNEDCATGDKYATTAPFSATTGKSVTMTVNETEITAALGTTGAGKLHVCYKVTGANLIPPSNFTVTGRLVKSTGDVNSKDPLFEQDNICKGPLLGMSGGIKIDVRNYASSKERASSGYESIIRLINNSDTQPAQVFAQIIHQDGKLGGWGEIANLPVRGVKNMSATEIEALLTNAPSATQDVTLYGTANGAVAPEAGKAAPRLRITSNDGTTLRVQNYHYNYVTNQLLEVSGAQGVDFENTANNRTPATAVDAQPVAQDALSGINLKN